MISECTKYRYMLARMWDPYFPKEPSLFADPTRPLMVFVMLNPSTADALQDDPTIRKCVGFARKHQCGGILVVNLFAWRATDPRELLTPNRDHVGEHNEEMIRTALGNPMMAIGVAGWGAIKPKVRRRALSTIGVAKHARKLWCFGRTKAGEPRHPLMPAYDTPLVSLSDGEVWPG